MFLATADWQATTAGHVHSLELHVWRLVRLLLFPFVSHTWAPVDISGYYPRGKSRGASVVQSQVVWQLLTKPNCVSPISSLRFPHICHHPLAKASHTVKPKVMGLAPTPQPPPCGKVYFSLGGGMRGSRYLLNSLINCHGPQFVSLGLLILPSHLSGLVIKWTQIPTVIQLKAIVRHFLLFLQWFSTSGSFVIASPPTPAPECDWSCHAVLTHKLGNWGAGGWLYSITKWNLRSWQSVSSKNLGNCRGLGQKSGSLPCPNSQADDAVICIRIGRSFLQVSTGRSFCFLQSLPFRLHPSQGLRTYLPDGMGICPQPSSSLSSWSHPAQCSGLLPAPKGKDCSCPVLPVTSRTTTSNVGMKRQQDQCWFLKSALKMIQVTSDFQFSDPVATFWFILNLGSEKYNQPLSHN